MKYPKLTGDNIYFSSDWHLNHTAISGPGKWSSGYRNFSSTHEMNKHFIEKINNTVPKDGHLFFLGDFAFKGMGANKARTVSMWRNSINCDNIYWVLGNHDFVTEHPDFNFVGHYLEMEINNQQIIMSHYPILSWHWIHKGSWNLHGHCHGNANIQELNKTCKRLDVGIDSYLEFYGEYGVFTFNQVKNIMDNKTIINHH